MYGIEQKIINFFKNKKSDGLTTKNVVENTDDKNEKNVEVSTSNEEKENKENSTDGAYEQLIKNLGGYNQELQKLTGKETENAPEILSDEEIEEKVANEVDVEYDAKYKTLDDKLTSQKEKLKLQDEAHSQNAKEKNNANIEDYKQAKIDINDNAIKKGISRSSIVDEMLGKANLQFIDETNKLKSELERKLKENSQSLDDAKREYQTATQNLDVKKAVDLKNQIEKAKENQKKEIKNYYEKSWKALDNFGEISSDSEDGKKALDVFGKIISETLAYYATMPIDEARESFKNDETIKALLGKYAQSIENYLNANL